MGRLRRALPLLLIGAGIRCGPAAPKPDGFYVAPTRKPSSSAEARVERRPGHLIRSEPFPGKIPGAQAWKILYVSTGLDGLPVEVSGLVVAPKTPAPPGGRPVVAWAHPTTGVAENCAPSLMKDALDTIPHLPALMTLDYIVVATDYPGLGTPGPHPYLVGESEGRAVLDSVRAARFLPNIGASTRFVAWGHSQGGHAALFAGELAREYAPDLTLMGVAAIAPATELLQLLKDDLDEHAGKIVASYCLWSWSRVYRAPLDRYIEAPVLKSMDRLAEGCVETDGEMYRLMVESVAIPADYVATAIYTSAPWNRLLEENRPGRAPAGAPLYVAQGTEDAIVRPSVTADFVSGLCRAGATVRYEPFPGVAHMRIGRISATSAIQWMRSRFEGAAAPNTCPPL